MSLADSIGLLFDKGGFVMVLLMGLSVYSLTLIALKGYQFYNARLFGGNPIADEVMLLLEAEEVSKARRHARNDATPMGQVIAATFSAIQKPDLTPAKRYAEIQRVGNAALHNLETHMKGLEMAANIAPLLGLLGTVIGMVKAFATLQGAGSRVDPSVLAGGIWEALLTTAGGLMIAIPAMAAFYWLDGFVERFRTQMRDVVTRIIEKDVMIAQHAGNTAVQAAPYSVPQQQAVEQPVYQSMPPLRQPQQAQPVGQPGAAYGYPSRAAS
jgi:biopolymer transport protein ExbB